MIKTFKKNNRGSIALTTVIALSAILLLAGITLILTTLDLTISTKSFFNITLAKNQSRACIEESLYKITRNTSYTGNFTLTYSTGSCSATVVNDTNPAIKIVTIDSTVGSHTFTSMKVVDTSVSPFSITN